MDELHICSKRLKEYKNNPIVYQRNNIINILFLMIKNKEKGKKLGYKAITIKDAICKIGSNQIYLPAIQRKFVWKPFQIEKLFDSIMRDYPIGTFLFWMLKEENVNSYTFYKFIQDYHERDSKNELAPKPQLKKNIIGILDGQQRLSSMYIAMQGSYAYKKPYCQWNNDNAFLKRKLYINLLFFDINEDYKYQFLFLTEEEAKNKDEKHLWFDVRDILNWGKDPDIDGYYDGVMDDSNIKVNIKQALIKNRADVKKILRILHQKIVNEELLNYYEVNEQELDNILDVFIRVNSAGTVLSKSDLLFSTIVAHWEDGREQIDSLVTALNKIGDTFKFDSDFIMRACLFLIDAPVLFKVKSFDKSNIDKIKKEWNRIKKSLMKSINLVSDFGFNYENLTSSNAVIPIAYYYYHDGSDKKVNKEEMKKYLISVLLKKLFGTHADQILTHMRESMNKSKIIVDKDFSFDKLASKFEIIGRKSLKVLKEDITDIMDYKKGAYTFMVLSLLYPDLKYNQVKFHQDHIHPYALFCKKEFNRLKLSDEDRNAWIEMRDKLANLQMLEGKENVSKQATQFTVWLNKQRNKKDYIANNYIDSSVDYTFDNFKEFYEKRKKLMEKKIMRILG
ncbi:MAG: DUF262 domain-containing protein [Mobilitalea sp.]